MASGHRDDASVPLTFPPAPAWALMASLLSLFNLGSPFPAQSAKAEQCVEGQA